MIRGKHSRLVVSHVHNNYVLQGREAQLRAQEEEMKERDAEINRLLGELRRYQTQLLRLQVLNSITIILTHNN